MYPLLRSHLRRLVRSGHPTGRTNAVSSDAGDVQVVILSAFVACSTFAAAQLNCEESPDDLIKSTEDAPGLRPGMKVYSRVEVAKHNSLYTGVWTTFGNGTVRLLSRHSAQR